MNKTQRLRNAAEGFMSGLLVCGFTGPWVWAHHEWEGAFYKAWRMWPPKDRTPQLFPTFKLGGGAGATSQARDMLWQLKRTSPFHDYGTRLFPQEPFGLPPHEYLEIHVEGATPQEWRQLAHSFLAVMAERG